MAGTFVQDITGWKERTGLRLNTILKRVAYEGASRLIQKTPVDTGRARGSWRVAINQIDLSNEPKRTKASKYKGKGGVQAIDLDETAYVSRQINKAKFGDAVFISNTVEYIEALENGHSGQSKLMLKTTFEELKADLERIITDAKYGDFEPGVGTRTPVIMQQGGTPVTARQAFELAHRYMYGTGGSTAEQYQALKKGTSMQHYYRLKQAASRPRGGAT